MIKNIKPDSLAVSNPRLVAGLMLVSINGQGILGLSSGDAIKELKRAANDRPLELVFQPAGENVPLRSAVRKAIMTRDELGSCYNLLQNREELAKVLMQQLVRIPQMRHNCKPGTENAMEDAYQIATVVNVERGERYRWGTKNFYTDCHIRVR